MRLVHNPQDPFVFQTELVQVLKNQVDAATNQLNLEQQKLIDMMGEDQKTKTGGGWKVTVVRGQRMKINEAGLKKALGARDFNKVCKQVLDNKKLEDAINAGEIGTATVAQYTEFTDNKPYVRISKADPDADEERKDADSSA